MLEKTLESPLDCKEIQPVHSKGDQSWVFFGRNDAKAETPVLWPPHVKSWLTGKDCDAGRDWGQEEKGTTEDEMFGWHYRLDGHESEWTLGVGDGQGDLVCCDSWGHKESDMTEQLNWPELNWIHLRLWVMILYAHTHITHIGLCIQQTVNKQWLDKGSWESTTIQVLCRCLQGVIGIWKLMKIWYSASKSYLS